jgi:acyl-CoA synthetase (AMP-forming)/AMP-acid ligase II/thioesterase domain-containing protein/acyl carrier protein
MLSVPSKQSVLSHKLSIINIIETQVRRDPNAIAVLGHGRLDLTYLRLHSQVSYVVDTLNRFGIGRTDRVGLIVPNGPELAVTFLSVAAGASCAPLNPSLSENEFEFYLSDLNAKSVIIHSKIDSPAATVARRLGIGILRLAPSINAEAGLFELNNEVPSAEGYAPLKGFAESDETALVLHTSGTTSKPKTVPLTQANLCNSAANIAGSFSLTDNDRSLNVMPLYHVHGLVGALLSSLVAGGSVVCCPGFDATTFFDWMDAFHPTWYTAVPTIHQAVLSHGGAKKEIIRRNRLRFIRSCSAPLPPRVMQELEQMFDAPVIESYGMTEASHQMTSNPLPPFTRKPGSVGKPTGPEVAIMDTSGHLSPPGHTGEIVIRGANVMTAYAGDSIINAAAFANGWFRTGDQGFFDADGYLFINGRIKEMINRGGEKISPREIDEIFLNHPAVDQALAFSVPHPSLGEDVYVAVVLRSGASITEQTLNAFARTRLSASKAPRRIVIVNEIPKGPTGKPLRTGLADKLGFGTGPAKRNTPIVRPRNRVEEEVARIWLRILKVDPISVTTDFFESGGDSLKAMELLRGLKHQFGVTIPPSRLLDSPTIEALAVIIEHGKDCVSSSLVTMQPLGSRQPFFLVNSLGWQPFGFRNLPQYLGPEQPLYILTSRGLDGKQKPHDRIDVMASDYLNEVRRIQPDGPYLFGGYSSGGVVAFEMAQQLLADGKEVGLLVLIDTRLGRDHKFVEDNRMRDSRIFALARVLDDYIGQLLMLHAKGRLKHAIQLVKVIVKNALTGFGARLFPQVEDTNTRDQRKVLEANQQAIKAYMPRMYPGRLTFVMCTDDSSRSSQDSRLAWGRVAAEGLEIHVLAGDHLTVLEEPQLKVLADQLNILLLNRLGTNPPRFASLPS